MTWRIGFLLKCVCICTRYWIAWLQPTCTDAVQDLVSLVTADVETVELFFAHTIAPGFVAIMIPGTVLAVVAYFAWPLALVLLPLLLLVALSPFGRTPTGPFRPRTPRATGEVNAYTVDSVQGVRKSSPSSMAHDNLPPCAGMERVSIRSVYAF